MWNLEQSPDQYDNDAATGLLSFKLSADDSSQSNIDSDKVLAGSPIYDIESVVHFDTNATDHNRDSAPESVRRRRIKSRKATGVPDLEKQTFAELSSNYSAEIEEEAKGKDIFNLIEPQTRTLSSTHFNKGTEHTKCRLPPCLDDRGILYEKLLTICLDNTIRQQNKAIKLRSHSYLTTRKFSTHTALALNPRFTNES